MRILRWIWSRVLLTHHRTSDKEIRSLFGYLAQLDAVDFVEVYPGVTVLGYAAFVHVRAGADQFTVSTSLTGSIIVQDLAKKSEKVHVSYPHFPVKTRWRLVYRSGELVSSVRFVGQLRQLRRAVLENHRGMSAKLEDLKWVVPNPDFDSGDDARPGHYVLDECVFDPKSPGFMLRVKDHPEVFITLTYAEAVAALAQPEAA